MVLKRAASSSPKPDKVTTERKRQQISKDDKPLEIARQRAEEEAAKGEPSDKQQVNDYLRWHASKTGREGYDMFMNKRGHTKFPSYLLIAYKFAVSFRDDFAGRQTVTKWTKVCPSKVTPKLFSHLLCQSDTASLEMPTTSKTMKISKQDIYEALGREQTWFRDAEKVLELANILGEGCAHENEKVVRMFQNLPSASNRNWTVTLVKGTLARAAIDVGIALPSWASSWATTDGV